MAGKAARNAGALNNVSGVNSVLRAMGILDLLGRSGKRMGVTEIGAELGLHKSTVYRILSTLEQGGYVQQDLETGKYSLGTHILELGMQCLQQIDLREKAGPIMKRLSAETGEVVHLAILDGLEVVYIDKAEQSQTLTMRARIGARAHAHCTALGKVLLAFRGNEVMAHLEGRELVRQTPNTITSVAELRAHLSLVRERGYAIDDEENEQGVRCVAVPIRNHAGTVVAAMSISAPSVRLTRERVSEVVPLILRAGRDLSEALGYRPGPPECQGVRSAVPEQWV
ncbi:MAG TPA: IclR family transcriptional regulator [Firmicutes bacterium]|nr:IclR family transcriptional regulator [Bacillota bacterium]